MVWVTRITMTSICAERCHAHWQVECSLQPWRAFKPDGVILFSDILTPLAGMGIEFDIVQGKGPIIADPIRTLEVRPACPPSRRCPNGMHGEAASVYEQLLRLSARTPQGCPERDSTG